MVSDIIKNLKGKFILLAFILISSCLKKTEQETAELK